ncbi:hypothetical protein [Synechococcus sp. CBW1108]|uniref:hypothetical protein n=1 Tax=Synechococcus sp. CBW1108 TaxID=1353147 RepID=UPI0018CD9592|nr:hypothetical protein [Synechococcus sp. CBW1108]QPN69905.1 hypothetical protein H8F27_15935 [Synechococcus sp. CBW1108]
MGHQHPGPGGGHGDERLEDLRYDRWIQAQEVILGELMHGTERCREVMSEQAIKLGTQKPMA